LEKDAAASREAEWFFAWVKSAMLYLGVLTAYVGAVMGLVVAWKKLLARDGESANVTIYALAGVLALPLLFALLFNLLPAIRRRRERNLRPTGAGKAGYFTTAPREEDPEGLFRTGYEPFLEWAAEPPAPLLHLTGMSGSGKSSLLGAYLAPHLAAPKSGPKTRVLAVRSYADPLAAMKEALLPLWKKPPDDYATLSPLEALGRAADRLGKGERLLVAFDQFEEFFLLRASPPPADGGKAASPAPAAPIIPDAELVPLRDFFRAFLDAPPERVALLLSYRSDHSRLLAPLGLPARNEGVNHRIVEPLDFAAAARFLQSCPGLAVPGDRMERVLREAARQEDGRVVMRPIVANFLGLILQKMSGHPTLWRRKGDLLRGYVRDTLGTEMAVERARLLGALLTDFHTARPRTLPELAAETGRDGAALEGELEYLEHAGLLRRLHSSDGAQARRTWQIAHDFLATLIERVLDGMHRTFWRTVRPWLAPAAIVLALGAGVVWPQVQRQLARNSLYGAGFTWNEQDAEIVAATPRARELQDLAMISHPLHYLKPRRLKLGGCSNLPNVDALKGLTALKDLDLSDCKKLQNVDGLKGLTALQNLNLSACANLQNVDALKGLTALQDLNLSACANLPNVDALKGLTALYNLKLSACANLHNVDALNGLTALYNLNLSACANLQNVDGLKGLKLSSLDVRYCWNLSIESLDALEMARPRTLINRPDGSLKFPR
jgi:hypothetical protein